jgi:hypothetical protein
MLAVVAYCSACSEPSGPDPGGEILPDGGPAPACDRRVDPHRFNVDIPVVAVSGRITVNGQVPRSRFGTVTLRDPVTGGVVTLGKTGDMAYTSKLVVPGSYDVYYAFNPSDNNPMTDVPRNLGARLRRSVLIQGTSLTLDIDIPAVQLSGKITVLGKVPKSTSGSVLLRNAATGDSAVLGRTGDMGYLPKLIVAGTYDLHYAWGGNDSTVMADVPRNLNAPLRRDVVLQGASAALDVDIPAVSLSGKITVNGQVPKSSYGSVYLRNAALGDSAFLGRTGDMSYPPRLVVPGTYDVHYAWSSADNRMTDVPRNLNAPLQKGVALQGPSAALDVDIPAVSLSGKITVNGQVPRSPFGSVVLRGVQGGDSAVLGRTGDMNYIPKLVVPGTYDIHYAWNSADSSETIDVPRNQNARIRQGVVLQGASAALDVDIPAVQMSGKITINGALPKSTFGSVVLRSGGDSAVLGRTGAMNYITKLIVRGRYDLSYAWNSADTTAVVDVPRNQNARLLAEVTLLGTSAMLDVDVPAVQVSGQITVGGQVPRSAFGAVRLLDRAAGDSAQLGRTGEQAYVPKLLVPGTYDLTYAWNPADNNAQVDVPRNTVAAVGCAVLKR